MKKGLNPESFIIIFPGSEPPSYQFDIILPTLPRKGNVQLVDRSKNLKLKPSNWPVSTLRVIHVAFTSKED